jgi:hypothetical protein
MQWLCLLAGFLPFTLTPVSSPANSPSLSESAQQLAGQVARMLAGSEDRVTVAVFPFANDEGHITADMGDLPAFVQGEMIHTLTTHAEGGVFVLNKAMLARRFKDRGIAPEHIDASKPERIGEILRQLDIDVAIFGMFDDLTTETYPPRDVKINAALCFATGELRQLVGNIDRVDVRQHAGVDAIPRFEPARRLKVQVLAGGRTLPLWQCQNPESSFCGNLFLQVPRDLLGKEYQIRLENRGTPPLDQLRRISQDREPPEDGRAQRNAWYVGAEYQSRYDPDRLIGVAVFVDGVSSRYQRGAQGDFVPVSRPPDKVPRWLLTPPGYLLQSGNLHEDWDTGQRRIHGGRLARTGGPGQSVLTLSGFQVDDETVRAFVFGDAGESLAETMGITKEIGLISIYVFPEEVPTEQKRDLPPPSTTRSRGPEPQIGTILGRPLPQKVQGFQVQLVEEFRQVWKIHYRLEGEPFPVPDADLVLFEQP